MIAVSTQLREDFESFARRGLPRELESYILNTYRLNLTSTYAGIPVKNPFGKASGQLSLALHQVQRDAEIGLGFCVLKTVVAQDNSGDQSMRAWAIPETRMLVERIHGTRVDEDGWTVTWKGRGWSESFASYLAFFRDAVRLGDAAGMPVIPTCTFHLPADPGTPWRVAEYDATVSALLDAWNAAGHHEAMPIEKDFSPTLAGSDLATQQSTILEWLDRVPLLMRRAAGDRPITIGMKIFNAMFEDRFQVEMLRRCVFDGFDGFDGFGEVRNSGSMQHPGNPQNPSNPDFLIYGNRLFDPAKEFEGKRGVAYGGPDLSARNLAVLDAFWGSVSAAEHRNALPISATGNIDSGARAVEYLKRGCSTFQIHTFFQLPDDQYAMTRGPKVERALHQLLFHPAHGFIASVLALREERGWPEDWDIARMAREAAPSAA